MFCVPFRGFILYQESLVSEEYSASPFGVDSNIFLGCTFMMYVCVPFRGFIIFLITEEKSYVLRPLSESDKGKENDNQANILRPLSGCLNGFS